MEKRIRWSLILGGIVALSLSAQGQTPPPTSALVGVRAAGMGDAYTAIAEGAAGHFHNPAGLGVGEGVRLFGQTNLNDRERLKLDPKGIAFRWRGMGLAWGNRIQIQPEKIADYTYLGGGGRLSSYIAVGVNAKFYRVHPSEHFQIFGRLPTFDFGVLAAPTPDWTLGIRASALEHRGGVRSLTCGTAIRVASTLFAVDGEWRDDGFHARVGAERTFFHRFAARAGWRDDSPSVGFGVFLPHTRLDAAWTRYEGMNLFFIAAELDLAGHFFIRRGCGITLPVHCRDSFDSRRSPTCPLS